MKTIIATAAALLAATTIAEQYRLKFPATVDVIENGSVTGTKRLKSGTVLELASDAAQTNTEKAAKNAPRRAGRLTPSKTSPMMFKNNGKPKTTLRAYIELGSYYNGQFSEKKSTYWNVGVATKNDDWSYAVNFEAYLPKSSPVAKRLIPKIQDGKTHKALVTLTPIKDEYCDDFVTIDDFELLPESD